MSARTGHGPGLGPYEPIAIAPEPPDPATAASLLASYRADLAERFPGGFTLPPGWVAVASQLVRRTAPSSSSARAASRSAAALSVCSSRTSPS